MGDKDKSKISNSEMENLSLDTSRYSKDLLTRFMGSSGSWREGEFGAIKEEGCDDDDDDDDDEKQEIELNLGLSLGGRLGVDKGSMKLIRSSSVAACLPIFKDEDEDDAFTPSPPADSYSKLVRTTSLPLGGEEELKKRKELQTLRRMEAKKRRSEKQKNLKGEREEGSKGGAQLLEKDKVLEASKRITSWVAPPFRSAPPWYVEGKATGMQCEIGAGVAKGKGMQEFGHILTQEAVESQEGSSSEMDYKSLRRTGSCGDMNPGNIQLLQEGSNQDVGSSSRTKTNLGRTSSLDVEKTSKQSDMTRSNQVRETRALEDMPCVFTKGDGPNGRRVDGILYKYGRGEDVRIMCVCHGSFHSPAEFVKHAGGADITHPLKHIVINPNSTPFN